MVSILEVSIRNESYCSPLSISVESWGVYGGGVGGGPHFTLAD